MKPIKVITFIVLLSLFVFSSGFFEQDELKTVTENVKEATRDIANNNTPSLPPTRQTRPASKVFPKKDPSQKIMKITEVNTADIPTLIKGLQKTKGCYESDNCDFPETDPKSYHFAVGKALRQRILSIKSLVENEDIVSEEISQLGQEFLAIPDASVKSAALQLLATQETSEATMMAILNEVINYHQAELIVHAMLELQRYIGSPSEEKMHQVFAQAMATGAPFVSQEISKNIGPFINKQSIDFYEIGLKEVLVGTLTYDNLESIISEYKKINGSA